MKSVSSFLVCASLMGCGGSTPSANPAAPAETAPPAAAASEPATAPPPAEAEAVTKAPPAESVAPTAKLDVSGTINGKPFAPKLAWVFSQMADGYATINFMEKEPCSTMADGDVGLGVLIPWEKGASVDLSTQRDVTFGKQKVRLAAAAFIQNKTTKIVDKKTGIPGARTENTPVPGFKPKGKATVLAAPTTQNSVGKLEIDLTSGDFTMKGTVDVKLCADLKPPP